jgi:hypothetical protein
MKDSTLLKKMSQKQRGQYEGLRDGLGAKIVSYREGDGELGFAVALTVPKKEQTLSRIQIWNDGDVWLYFGDSADPGLIVEGRVSKG